MSNIAAALAVLLLGVDTAPPVIEVHLLPHAHCDTGWLMTVDGYFEDKVTHILTTVTEALHADHNRTFIWSEIKWIQMWWPSQSEITRNKFRGIVERGQFEFVGAGWSQNDEVTPHYTDIIANQATGRAYLRSIGLMDLIPGKRIKTGWQIDMFAGFSGATPSLWAMGGYDAMFSRWEGTTELAEQFQGAFEFIWEASASLAPNRSRMFNHIINGNYGDLAGGSHPHMSMGLKWAQLDCPRGTQGAWEEPCTPTDGSPPVNASNLAQYASEFAGWVKTRHAKTCNQEVTGSGCNRGPVYRSRHHLAVWGSDYLFSNAGAMYANMEKIVAAVNAAPDTFGIRVQYTTLSRYAAVVHAENREGALLLPVKRDVDFEFGWPHAWTMGDGNASVQYQSGAATSRSDLKQTTRAASALHKLALAQQALALVAARAVTGAEGAAATSVANSNSTGTGTGTGTSTMNSTTSLFPAWDALGVMQHHDALTGTQSAAGSFVRWGRVAATGFVWDDHCGPSADPAVCVGCNSPKCMCYEAYRESLAGASALCAGVLEAAVGNLAQAGAEAGALSTTQRGADTALVVANPLAIHRRSLVEAALPASLATTTAHAEAGTEAGAEADAKAGAAPVAVVDVASGEVVPAQLSADGRSVAFVAELAPLGFRAYAVRAARPGDPPRTGRTVRSGAAHARVGGMAFGADGALESWKGEPFTARHMVYRTSTGGAYCLIEQSHATPVPGPTTVLKFEGPLYTEVRSAQPFGDTRFHQAEASAGADGPTLRMTVRALGPAANVTDVGADPAAVALVTHDIPVLPWDHEVIARLSAPGINNSAVALEHDDSGFEFYTKLRNATLPVSGQYHAMVQCSSIRDDDDNTPKTWSGAEAKTQQLTLLSSHTKGVASLAAGELEYMMARRINGTDDQGPWPLNETVPLSIKMAWHFGQGGGGIAAAVPARTVPNVLARRAAHPSHVTQVAIALENPPVVLYAAKVPKVPHSTPVATLPDGVHILHMHALEAADGSLTGEVVVRLQNVVPLRAGAGVGTTRAVKDVAALVAGRLAARCREVTLFLDQDRDANDETRMQWIAHSDSGRQLQQGGEAPAGMASGKSSTAGSACKDVALAPLDIRTFVLGF